MIIDAMNSTSGKNGRPYTVKAAVADAIDEIPVGGNLVVDAIKGAVGQDVPWERVTMCIAKVSGDRRFTTRQSPTGGFPYTIYRVA